jgi:hypothetical protein
VADGMDASGGKLKAALTSSTPLFVTSEQYDPGAGDFTCLNVMVDRQDYRLVIGYDNLVVRVETLDARAARAQTRADLSRHTPVSDNAPDAAIDLGDDPYANNPAASLGDNYGNAPANPYGVPIRANSDPYGVPIRAN